MADETLSQIDALLKEDREFAPSAEFANAAHVSDPAIYEEDGRVYLLYAVAGESGIAIAEVKLASDGSTPAPPE